MNERMNVIARELFELSARAIKQTGASVNFNICDGAYGLSCSLCISDQGLSDGGHYNASYHIFEAGQGAEQHIIDRDYSAAKAHLERLLGITAEEQKEREVLKTELPIEVTQEDIDDIVAGALEGGIDCWCDDVKVVGVYLGEYASEQISRGGRLLLHDFEKDETYTLDKEKLLNGLKMYFEKPHPFDILEEIDNKLRIDCGNANGIVCDMIVQYALFGEVVYG